MRATAILPLIILAQLSAPSVLAGKYNDFKGVNFYLGSGGSGGVISVANKVGEGREFAINPKVAEFYYHQGKTYYYLSEYHSAITNYNEAISLRPNYAEAYYYRGLAYDRKGLFKKALADLRAALSKNAFSVSINKWNDDARKKISELEMKISEVAEVLSPTQ